VVVPISSARSSIAFGSIFFARSIIFWRMLSLERGGARAVPLRVAASKLAVSGKTGYQPIDSDVGGELWR
jgi:hypothetical protein